MMEGGKYEREWHDDPSKDHPIATPFLRVTYLSRHHVTHQGETRQKV
jgi:hypothetical protein